MQTNQEVQEVNRPPLAELDFYKKLLQHTSQNGMAFAAWRLPQKDERHALLSNRVTRYNITDELEALDPGFIFHPYDKHRDGYFIPADYSYSIKDGKLSAPQSEEESVAHRLLYATDDAGPASLSLPKLDSKAPPAQPDQHYQHLVEKCITAIDNGRAEKIVPSRFRKVELTPNFDIGRTFGRFCDQYPNALVSLVYIPDVGCWLGASPELLVSIEEGIFRTVALAGTQPYSEGMNLKSVAWTQKEIEEQALVERYIISCFKKIRLREYDEHGPKTVVAGGLLHLRSDFSVNLKETHFPQLGSIMLQLLHPTSAVCGMPHDEAQQFLDREEGYDRQFYAGFLGPVNVQSGINLYVNLRCMQFAFPYAFLYAGAGVTSDSIPESEWEETEIKLNALNKMLQ